MTGPLHRTITAACALLALAGCTRVPTSPLAGAWRANVQFSGGAFATIHDLQFLYAYNAGGTMTESSNYDAVPPVPPAYGEWHVTGERKFRAKYTFFTTQPPSDVKAIASGGGWLPAGYGVLTEDIELAPDGRAYDSTIQLDLFDTAGKPVTGGGRASAHAVRMGS